MLFPVLQRAQVYADQLRELRLADLRGFADGTHVGLGKLRDRAPRTTLPVMWRFISRTPFTS